MSIVITKVITLIQERPGVLAATCLSMRNNAPVEHCVAEAFILHRVIVLTMKVNITLCAYLDLCHEYCAMKNKTA